MVVNSGDAEIVSQLNYPVKSTSQPIVNICTVCGHLVHLLYKDGFHPSLFPSFLLFSSFPSSPLPLRSHSLLFSSFRPLDVPLGAESLHKALTPRVKEKGAAKREKGREKGTGKIEGERSQRRREEEEESKRRGEL